MIIYLINIILIIFWGMLFLGHKVNKNKKKIFCAFSGLQWILLSGLRHITIGADTYTYKVNFFDLIPYDSWNELFTNFYQIIFLNQQGKDPGYPILEKIVYIFTSDYQVFLIIIAIMFTVPMSIFIYKYSSNPCISFIIYSTLFYSFFAITGHRQTIATSMVIFGGYELIKNKKLFAFILIVFFAFTIHKSAVCLVPFYFIANKKITKKYIIFVLISFIFIFILKNRIMTFLAYFTGYEDYANQFEGAGTWTFTAMFLIITLVAIWKLPELMKNNNKNNDIVIWCNAIFTALIFLPLTFVNPSAMRIVQYFSIFIIVLIPEIIKSFKIKEQPIIYYIGTLLMILLLVKNNPEYLFFWQNVSF